MEDSDLKRSQLISQVEALAEQIAPTLGVALIDVEMERQSGTQVLRVYIDREGGTRLEDCENVTRELGRLLDELDLVPGAYSLEVSSAGLERVLKKDREYRHFAGRRVDISLYEPVPEIGRRFSGILAGEKDGVVAVQLEDGRMLSIEREKIARAKLVLVTKRG